MGLWNAVITFATRALPFLNQKVIKNKVMENTGKNTVNLQTRIDYGDMKSSKKDNYMNKLIKTDNNYSIVGFFLIITIIIGIVMIAIAGVAIVVDLYYHHSISVDLNGLAAYITSIAGVFASGGFTYAWTMWSTNKYGDSNIPTTNTPINVDETPSQD